MAYSPDFGTGFEHGSVEIIDITDRDDDVEINSTAAYVKTGTYALYIKDGYNDTAWVRFAYSGAYIDLAVWFYPMTPSTNREPSIEVILDDGYIIELVRDYTNRTWDAYVDGVLAQAGSIATANDAYHHIQARFFIDNSGYIQTKIDGVEDIDYSGDTQPDSSAEIEWLRFIGSASGNSTARFLIDDLTYGTGGWPGDIRFDWLSMDGDDSVEWTPSTGADNYAMVDEVPPSDSDYVSAGSPDLTDVYTVEDWSGSSKSPQFLVAWARARKDEAEQRSLELLINSGGSESSSGSFDITTSFTYYKHIFETDPSTGSLWTDSAIDAIKAGIRSY